MTPFITVHESGMHLVIGRTPAGEVCLLHCAALPFDAATLSEQEAKQWRLVEVQVVGENVEGHHGNKHTGTLPGGRLRYVNHRDELTAHGRTIEIDVRDDVTGLLVTGHLQWYTGLSVLHAWTTVTNQGPQPVTLDYVTSFALTGLAKEGQGDWQDTMQVHIPHNSWQGEGQWRCSALPALGLSHVAAFSVKRLSITNLGTWSTSQYLPMGVIENTQTATALAWQIEHNGSWQWEISDSADQLYLHLSGPTGQEHQWEHTLPPGATFMTVPVGVAVGQAAPSHSAFEDVIGTLTRYRRTTRRPNRDNEHLPVIFNDYMNCLNGDPTTAKELPLIARAAAAGCEVYCIDAGWYADGPWWDTVGEWLPAAGRFPDGLAQVLATIRQAGMVPGLWLEIEVMGIHSAFANALPDAWFFLRRGQRVRDNGRYQLDFRHPAVQAFADGIIERLVGQYGVGYIKMDYNNNFTPGTQTNATSLGDGLLQHNRAYLAWLDRVFARYPDLIIENCGSGGLRMDYALLSRHSIQSTSDQMDYRKTSVIAATIPTAVTPEQAGIWAYPLATDDQEGVISNMVNALLGRVQLSGQLADLAPAALAQVHDGIAVYKQIRHHLPQGIPFWPLGLPTFRSGWACLGMDCGAVTYLAVWRLHSPEASCTLPLRVTGHDAACIYPLNAPDSWQWDGASGQLQIDLPQCYSARLFAFTPRAV